MKKTLSLVLISCFFTNVYAGKSGSKRSPIVKTSFSYTSLRSTPTWVFPNTSDSNAVFSRRNSNDAVSDEEDDKTIRLNSSSQADKDQLAELVAKDGVNVKCLNEAIKEVSEISKNQSFRKAVAEYEDAYNLTPSTARLNLFYEYDPNKRSTAKKSTVMFELLRSRRAVIAPRRYSTTRSEPMVISSVGKNSNCNFSNLQRDLTSQVEDKTRRKIEQDENERIIRIRLEEEAEEKRRKIEESKKLIEDFS